MASSALYRYFGSRDELLTRLIIDAYDSLGAAAEAAEATVDRDDLAARFAAICDGGPDLGAGPPERVRADLRLTGARLRRSGRHRPARAHG